jgi:hypothetical protein
MLAKSGALPTRGSWSFEVKWDGFRPIVSTEGPLRVRSRRGWNMTPQIGFLEQLPVRVFGDCHLLTERPLEPGVRPDLKRCLAALLFTGRD